MYGISYRSLSPVSSLRARRFFNKFRRMTVPCLSDFGITLRMGIRFLVHVGTVLADDPVAVKLKGAEIVRGSRRLALPVVALGPLSLDLSGNRLGQEIVLVLGIVASQLANDGLVDQVLPPALLGKKDGVLGVFEKEGGIAAVGVGGGIPVHERVLPSLSDGTVVVERDLPVFFWIQWILVGTGAQLLDDHHALAPIGHFDTGLVGSIESGNLGLVFGQDGCGKIGSGIEDHHAVLFGHGLHAFRQSGDVFGFFRFSGLDEGLLHRNDTARLLLS
mmetsp:Transcript_20144/g.41770  ORF Transcript_20144/g.41770 Transcript_20144/m.41770 type:complete len:275 (+) Transcript_20144:107-931(+)